MAKQKKTEELKCCECRRKISYGGDVITAQRGVSGPRGVVPLAEELIFCGEECVALYFSSANGTGLPILPPRIP